MRSPAVTLSIRRYARGVRATITIDDDVLEATSCIANDEGVTVDDVISRLARKGLEPRTDDRKHTRFQAFTGTSGSRSIAPCMAAGHIGD